MRTGTFIIFCSQFLFFLALYSNQTGRTAGTFVEKSILASSQYKRRLFIS